MRKQISILMLTALLFPIFHASAINQRGNKPWGIELRSFYDDELGFRMWFLNLGPTGIRARILPDSPNQFLVEHVFQDDKSPAKGLVEKGDVIVGANGKAFATRHRFGRGSNGRGWDGPMREMAGHIEDSQGRDGVLELMVRPQGNNSVINTVKLQLEPVGRFANSFPHQCARSEALLEKLCDFIVRDYESDNWKRANTFFGNTHGEAHQLLALMASGISKYEPIIEKYRKSFHNNKYSPTDGGFRMWRWGYEGIIMGEMYRLYNDRNLVEPMRQLAEAQPWGSFNRNGIYTHRSFINIRGRGGKPYASIAALSGLQMVSQSIFRHLGLHYEEDLLETIYHHYLRAARPDSVAVSYAFGGRGESSLGRDARHAIIHLKDPSQAKGPKGPGYVVPTGMKDITEYEIAWPTKADHRWKPTDWVEEERDQNIVEELQGKSRRINRYLGEVKPPADPTKPYNTTQSGKYLASIGMGAVAMTLGTPPRPGYKYLGLHAADTCALGPGNIFDGHAESNLHSFWAVLGAARSNDPQKLRDFFDYMKIFIVMSETHDGNGLYLQPWGRDWADQGPTYGPRILPTATGIMILSQPKRRLLITGADAGAAAAPAAHTTSQPGAQSRAAGTSGERPTWAQPPPWAQQAAPAAREQIQIRPARKLSAVNIARLERALMRSLHQLSEANALTQIPMQLSIAPGNVWLKSAAEDGMLTFEMISNGRIADIHWSNLAAGDHAVMAALVATLREDSSDAQALAGVYLEHAGSVGQADVFLAKANADSRQRLEQLFE